MACNICRTCLLRYDSNDPTMFRNIQDFVFHEMIKIKLIDMLIFLNCIEIDVEENWPQGMCAPCVSAAIQAFSFKRRCIEANDMLTRYSESTPTNYQRMNYFVYLDHEYDVPLYSHPPPIDCRLT